MSRVEEGSVNLYYKQENEQRSFFHSTLRPLKNLALGPYRTVMAFWTLKNFKSNPDISILHQAPTIQSYFEEAAYKLGLNPARNYITELHIPEVPWWWYKIKILGKNYHLPIPQFPVSTYHSHSDPVLNQATLESHRYDSFAGGGVAYTAALELLKGIFPEIQFTPDDFLLTCGPSFTTIYHNQIIKALKGKVLDNAIKLHGEKLIERWQEHAKKATAIELSSEMRNLTSAVITEVAFRNSKNHVELSEAVNFMNSYLLNKSLGLAKEGDAKRFDKARKVFRDTMNAILDDPDSDSLPLFQTDTSKGQTPLTKQQKLGLCLLLFFAGQETTAFALAHLFARLSLKGRQQIAIHHAIQKAKDEGTELKKVAVLSDFVNKTLLKIPPGNGLSRKLRVDTYISFKTPDDSVIGKYMRHGQRLLANIAGAAKIILDEKSNLTYDHAQVFGSGKHHCIGKVLAIKELFQFPAMFLSRFELIPTLSEFRSTSRATLQGEPFPIIVKERDQ